MYNSLKPKLNNHRCITYWCLNHQRPLCAQAPYGLEHIDRAVQFDTLQSDVDGAESSCTATPITCKQNVRRGEYYSPA